MGPMKGLFIRIDEALDQRLTSLCQKEGYKKAGLIARLIQNFLNQRPSGSDPIQEAKDFGIDTTLLASNLEKTPTERLENHASLYNFIRELKKGGEKR